MFIVFVGLLFFGVATFLSFWARGVTPFSTFPRPVRVVAGVACYLLSLLCFASTSYVFVGADETLHLKKVYGGSSLVGGRIVAADGEKGFQANVVPPGFHLWPLIRVVYGVEALPVVEIPAGFYGRITTKDGEPLPEGAIMADTWSDEEFGRMLDAAYFLGHGGQKGLQSSVLKPGKYRLNLYLFKVEYGNGREMVVYDQDGMRRQDAGAVDTRITEVPAGFVAVVKSNFTEGGRACAEKVEATARIEGALSAPLVPRGCKGIWREPLFPGAYFLNHDALTTVFVDTRVQAWEYKGGFTKRSIDLTISMDGTIQQVPRSEEMRFEEGYADKAVFVKVEGWDVPQELRVVVQISPENAPIVVASVGGLKEVEDRVLTPTIRSIVRNVVGSEISYAGPDGSPQHRQTRVLDLIENRLILEQNIEHLVSIEGRKAGVDVKEVRFGEPAIPPELLVTRQREQLSQQLKATFEKERDAQDQRVQTEKAKATADKQGELVQAQIEVQVSEQYMQRRTNEGQADRDYLVALAAGQKAQAEVLGQDRVVMLQLADKFLTTLSEHPELVKMVEKLVPQTVVTGGADLAGAAAVLGGVIGKRE